MSTDWTILDSIITFPISCVMLVSKYKTNFVKTVENSPRDINKNPIPTIVAECNNAETGVGPSIASVNHTDKITCQDLVIAANNNQYIE